VLIRTEALLLSLCLLRQDRTDEAHRHLRTAFELEDARWRQP
jgi:hypothetical protein